MNPALWAVLAMLAAAVVMFAYGRPRMDAVALAAICALPLTGVLTPAEALAGFGDPNVVLIAALFVLGEGLVRTGVAQQLGDRLAAHAGRSTSRLIALLMPMVCGLGSVMSSTAVTAIFIPVVLRICRRTNTAPGKLMMPLSFAALISGMTTLVATAPNLVVQAELVRRGLPGFGFFSFTPFGVPILLLCVGYMLIVRRKLPGAADDDLTKEPPRPTLADWVERYQLHRRAHRLLVPKASPLVGRTLESLAMRAGGVSLVAIERGPLLLQPTGKSMLHAGDVLFIDLFADDAEIDRLADRFMLMPLPLSASHFSDYSQDIGMAEMLVPADSRLVGKSIIESGIRTRFGFSVIGLRRGDAAVQQSLIEEKLQLGDVLLVIGPWKSIRNVRAWRADDLIPLSLPAEWDDVLPAPGKSLQAVVTLLLVVGLMVSGATSNVQAALAGCLLLGVFRCIDFDAAYRAIDWKTIVLIVGMLPFSMALERTGGVAAASDGLLIVTQDLGPRGVLAAIFLVTSLLGMFISNTATAILMAPVALTIAEHLEASPYPFAMIVALASSAAFMTPVSSPVNTLVVAPGQYRFGDFVRIGVPFTLICLVVCVLLVPILLPL